MPSRFNIAASRQKHLASCRRRRPSAATRLLTNSLSSGGAAANCGCSDKARGLCGLDAEPLFRTAKDPIWQGNGVGQYLPSDDIPKFQQPAADIAQGQYVVKIVPRRPDRFSILLLTPICCECYGALVSRTTSPNV